MLRSLTSLLLFFSCAFCTSQEDSCFYKIRENHFIQLEKKNNVHLLSSTAPRSRNDSILRVAVDSIFQLKERTKKALTGCSYPDHTFKTIEGIELTLSEIKSEITILNFNELHCDVCIGQLHDLQKLNKEFKGRVTVISVFSHNIWEIKPVTDKYKSGIAFVPNEREYKEFHSVGLAYPLNFVLDRNKKIVAVHSGAHPQTGHLYRELRRYFTNN